MTRGFATLTMAVALAWVQPAWATCILDPRVNPSISSESFVQNPVRMLEWFKGRQFAWTNEIAAIATRPASLPGFPALIRSSNPEQRSAIGRALGSVASKCRTRDASLVRRVSEVVSQSGAREVMAAFRAVADGEPGGLATGLGADIATGTAADRSSTSLSNVGGHGVGAGSGELGLANPMDLPMSGSLRAK